MILYEWFVFFLDSDLVDMIGVICLGVVCGVDILFGFWEGSGINCWEDCVIEVMKLSIFMFGDGLNFVNFILGSLFGLLGRYVWVNDDWRLLELLLWVSDFMFFIDGSGVG